MSPIHHVHAPRSDEVHGLQLNLMHRVIARVLLIEVWIHGFGMYVCYLLRLLATANLEFFPQYCETVSPRLSFLINRGLIWVSLSVRIWDKTWIWMGLVSAIAHAILAITSLKPIRRRFYEFFWIMHVFFVV